MTLQQETPAAARSKPAFGLTLLAVSMPAFLVALDNLVVSNALVSIKNDLGTSIQGLQWITNAYILGFASMLLAAAGIADRFGHRRVFLVGLVAFTVFSAGCALADTTTSLIVFRALQGVSASAILPVSLTLITRAAPPGKRETAIGLWAGITLLAPGASPLIGGAITENIGWHWLFWLNVPIGLVALPLVLFAVSESRGVARKLDVGGLVLGCAGVLGLVWGIVDSSDHGWLSARVLIKLGVAAALLVAFGLREHTAQSPLLPLRLFRNRTFVTANLTATGLSFSLFGSIFILSQYLQVSLGHSALVAGLWTLPWAVMAPLIAPISGKLTPVLGARTILAFGSALAAIGLAWIAVIASAGTPASDLVLPFALIGLGTGMTWAPTATAVVSSVPEAEVGTASGTNSTVREIGAALGIAVLITVFTANGSYASPQGFADGMVPGLWICVAVYVASALSALRIPRHLTVHKEQ